MTKIGNETLSGAGFDEKVGDYDYPGVIDRSLLAAISDPKLDPPPAIERGIADSISYLSSASALCSIAVDTYWPKWDSPWWHMLLLHELGESRQIPPSAIAAMVSGLNALPLHIFPIHPGDAPPGTDRHRDSSCHCALGCIAQVLGACGVDVANALPWVEPWFLRYQLADGGLNCDERAYLCSDECASSMVATIAPFEALIGTAKTAPARAFTARAGAFLIGRALSSGSPSVHNAVERDAALDWQKPCFPRFYFYDVLRGLAALVRWAEASEAVLPQAAILGTVGLLIERYPDGIVPIERNAHAGKTTLLPTPDRSPSPRAPASSFALLDAVSVLGQPSAALTREWSAARQGLLRLLDAGRLVSA